MHGQGGDAAELPSTPSGAGTIAAPSAQARVDERDAADAAPAPGTSSNVSIHDPPRSVTSVASLIGAKLVDRAGEPLGDVVDVTIDAVSGSAGYVVVAVGAVLGLGGVRFAVPWSVVHVDGGTLRVPVDRDTLMKAPIVEPDFWPEMSEDERWARAVHEHFNAAPYWLRR